MRLRHVTDDTRRSILMSYVAGVSPVVIAERTGLSRWQILRLVKSMGATPQSGGRAAVDPIIAEQCAGMPGKTGAVARALGVSRWTVWRRRT
jgi:hypothetical protein